MKREMKETHNKQMDEIIKSYTSNKIKIIFGNTNNQ
ncbi:hypothetical protein Q7M_1179 (plasmid) [Borrelia crocidurae str. Achema]|uniref:Uncharacterized protein n=1 Tax=Borrelia crocidurae (strain Achema) TaxID=1155096 RepID=I0FFC1_BORCA|nr:hypothetical protein Q7M_1179 [Borrelia crocidurae str. Achema]